MPDRTPSPVRLTDNQRRHYEVVFGRLEQSLAQIERAGLTDTEHDLLTFSTPDLPPRFADEAGPIIDDARAILADVVRVLALKPRGVSRRRTCRALITAELVRLEDCPAARLRGYGEVDATVGEHLDPLVERMHDNFGRLESLLRERPGGPRES